MIIYLRKVKIMNILWKKFNITIKKNKCCLDDIIDNIINTNKPNKYIEQIHISDRHIIKNKIYIDEQIAIDCIKTRESKTARNFIQEYRIHTIQNEILEYCEKKLMIIRTYDGLWLKCKDIGVILGYDKDSSKKMIRNFVNKDNKLMYRELSLKYNLTECDIFSMGDIIQKSTQFIHEKNLDKILSRSTKSNVSKIYKMFGITTQDIVKRIELEIVDKLILFFDELGIKYKHQHSVGKYRIDFYIPSHSLAIEIDEDNHKNRNPVYEIKREQFTVDKIDCRILRFDPYNKNFNIYVLIGKITHLLYEDSSINLIPVKSNNYNMNSWTLNYDNCIFDFVIDSYKNIWFKANNLTSFIGYANLHTGMNYVGKSNRLSISDIEINFSNELVNQHRKLTTMINEDGLKQLFKTSNSKTKKKEIQTFKKWLFEKILPKIHDEINKDYSEIIATSIINDMADYERLHKKIMDYVKKHGNQKEDSDVIKIVNNNKIKYKK